MHLMLLILMLTDSTDNAIFGETGVFEPLRRSDVAIATNGEVFILNFDEAVVIHYDPAGKKLGKFGGRGEGPGEFSHPSKIFVDESRLYVQDLGRDTMHIFDRTGKFVKTQSLPAQGLELALVKGGWIHANTLGLGGNPTPIQVVWVDESFQNPKPILTLERGPARGLRVEITDASQRPVAKYNPVADGPGLVGSTDGRTVWAKAGGSAVIHIIDAVKREAVGQIKRDDKAVPFNQEYGKKQFDEIAADLKKRHSPVELHADFPEAFPLVRDLSEDGSGHLLLRRWTGRPDKDESFVMYDAAGKEVTLPCKAEYLPRLIAIRGKFAWLSACREEGDAYLVKVPLDQLDKVAAAHPLEGEVKPRMLMRRR